MKRVAIVNQKGGVGKTTTTVNLGAALARHGKRVAILDLDPQGNASTHLGIDLKPGDPSTYGVLTGACSLEETLRETATPGLFVAPCDLDLSGAEMELALVDQREHVLRRVLDRWEREGGREGQPPVDVVLMDCPPSLGLLSLNALVAAREVIVALQAQFLSLQGLSKLLEVVGHIRAGLNPSLNVAGIVACQMDYRLRLSREVLGELRRHFPEVCFQRTIGVNVKLAEAPGHGKSIFDYAPGSSGARDYDRLAQEWMARWEPQPVA